MWLLADVFFYCVVSLFVFFFVLCVVLCGACVCVYICCLGELRLWCFVWLYFLNADSCLGVLIVLFVCFMFVVSRMVCVLVFVFIGLVNMLLLVCVFGGSVLCVFACVCV